MVRPKAALVAPACLLLLLAAPASTAFYFASEYANVRNDHPDPNYLIGNFTWSGGQGGVAWNRDAPTDDEHFSGGATTPVHTAEGAVNQVLYFNLGLGGPLNQPMSEFLSDPFDHDVLLNVSRPIQVDLMVKNPDNGRPVCEYGGNYNAGIEIRIYLGTQLIAGTYGYNYFYPYPAASSGYSVCMYRLAPEVDLLPAGSQLKVQIAYPRSTQLIKLGLSEDARSQIRLAQYPPFEGPYRDARIAGADPSNVGGASQTTEDDAAGAAVLGAFFLGVAAAAPFRRGRVAVLALLVVAVGLAGCIGSKSTGKTAASTSLGGASESLSDIGLIGKGRIVGLVHDDLHVPVGGAHLSLLGTAYFTQTDGHGRFQLDDVTPGAYVMRIDRKSYHTLETPVTVVAGKLTRLDVLLVPLVLKESDFRPHHHDYWLGRDTVEVMNADLGQRCVSDNDCEPISTFTLPHKGTEDRPNLILPGTYKVEVTVTWDAAQMGAERLGLQVAHNGDPFKEYNQNVSVYHPRRSGEPFHIATNWEMGDVGHQIYSGWEFTLFQALVDAPKVTDPRYVDNNVPRASAPSFKVKIVLHRGVIPLEPPHPDHWNGQTSIDAGKPAGKYYGHPLNMVLQDAFGYCFTSEEVWGRGDMFYLDLGRAKKIIPPGTTYVEIKLTANREPLVPFDWVLHYKPATHGPVGWFYPGTEGFAEAPPPTKSGLTYTWKIPVKEDQTDNLYAKRSAWHFGLVAKEAREFCADWHAYAATNPTVSYPWDFSGKATAFKE